MKESLENIFEHLAKIFKNYPIVLCYERAEVFCLHSALRIAQRKLLGAPLQQFCERARYFPTEDPIGLHKCCLLRCQLEHNKH